MTSEESRVKPAFYRPTERRLLSLNNEELQQLFELRASKVKLDPKGFWDDNRIVYWDDMIPRLQALYEVMLEIQARYPWYEITGGKELFEKLSWGSRFRRMLPLLEAHWIRTAIMEDGKNCLPNGLREIPLQILTSEGHHVTITNPQPTREKK